MNQGWRSPFIYPTSLFIRDYLLEHKEAYAQQIWRALREQRKKLNIYYGSYNSFWVNYFRNLIALGLIEEVRRETSARGLKKRKYFRIKPGYEDDPRWINIQKARYPKK
jgi:hypothetical protein